MPSSNVEAPKRRKTRKRPIYNKVRQLEWLVWRMASEHKCCFCAESLFSGLADSKKLNITVHHLIGSIHTDDRSEPSPVAEQLFAHGNCHKAYHHMERMIARDMNVDVQRFKQMEKNVAKETKRLRKVAASL